MCTFLNQITEDRKQKSDDRNLNSACDELSRVEGGMRRSEKSEGGKVRRCEGEKKNEIIIEVGNF